MLTQEEVEVVEGEVGWAKEKLHGRRFRSRDVDEMKAGKKERKKDRLVKERRGTAGRKGKG